MPSDAQQSIDPIQGMIDSKIGKIQLLKATLAGYTPDVGIQIKFAGSRMPMLGQVFTTDPELGITHAC